MDMWVSRGLVLSALHVGVMVSCGAALGGEIEKEIVELMAFYKVPGVSVAVIDDGKIAWAQGFGVLEKGGDRKVTTETLFQAASISKPTSAIGGDGVGASRQGDIG